MDSNPSLSGTRGLKTNSHKTNGSEESTAQSLQLKDRRYGFLSVVEVTGLGFCGGLLILSVNGRPIEFHCTTPVTTNRAQQILYGKTFSSFLYCDQIGVALCDKTKVPLDVIVAEQTELAPLSVAIKTPVVIVNSQPNIAEPETPAPNIQVSDVKPAWQYFGARDETADILQKFIEGVPLSEPFDRIRRAISEAHSFAA